MRVYCGKVQVRKFFLQWGCGKVVGIAIPQKARVSLCVPRKAEQRKAVGCCDIKQEEVRRAWLSRSLQGLYCTVRVVHSESLKASPLELKLSLVVLLVVVEPIPW